MRTECRRMSGSIGREDEHRSRITGELGVMRAHGRVSVSDCDQGREQLSVQS